MNPFQIAEKAGYSAKDVLNFAANAMPGFEDKIKYVLAAGYSADEVMKFLKNAFNGKIPRSYAANNRRNENGMSDAIKQKRAEIRQRKVSDYLDPSRLALAAGGAAIGGLTGGPAGAIAGAYGGNEAYEDILSKYEQQIQEGGNLSLQDYLKSLIKGASKGAAAAVVANKAKELLLSMQNKEDQKGPVEEIQEQAEEVEVPNVDPAIQEEAQAVEGPNPNLQSSFDILNRKGYGQLFTKVAKSAQTPEDAIGIMRQLDKSLIPALKRETKRVPEEILSEAFEYVNSQAPAQAPAGSPEAVNAVSPNTGPEAVEQFQGVQRAPQGLDESLNVEEISEDVNPVYNEKLGNVKRLDNEENPIASSLANIFNPQDVKPSDHKIEPIENALKSSNVRGAFYNAGTGKMRVVFAPKKGRKGGGVYSFPNVEQEDFNKLVGGKAKPVTEGSNEFGIWFQGKNRSIGASFHKNIKRNPEKFPPSKQEKDKYRVEEKQIIEADRTHLATYLFEPFMSKRERGRQIETGRELKAKISELKNEPDEFVADLVAYLEEEAGLKNPPTLKRLEKDFKKRF